MLLLKNIDILQKIIYNVVNKIGLLYLIIICLSIKNCHLEIFLFTFVNLKQDELISGSDPFRITQVRDLILAKTRKGVRIPSPLYALRDGEDLPSGFDYFQRKANGGG